MYYEVEVRYLINDSLKPSKRQFLLFLGIPVIWYSFVVLLPVFGAIRYSFFDWSGGPNMEAVGFANYMDILQDDLFWRSLKNNLVIILYCIIGQIGIALILSALLQSKFIKFKKIHRSVIFFPVVLSSVVIGFVWTIIYNKDYGLLNWLLTSLNLDFLIHPYLDDPKTILLFVSIPLIWKYIGYYMVLLLSGMSTIPTSVLEMSEIDGATGWRKLVYIIFPLIKSTIIVCIMLCIAGNMKIFDHILVMTGGGPGTSSMVLAIYAYKQSFVKYKLGYGSAASVLILIISLGIVLTTRYIAGREKSEN